MTDLKTLERRLMAAQLARDHRLAAELTELIERLHEEETQCISNKS